MQRHQRAEGGKMPLLTLTQIFFLPENQTLQDLQVRPEVQ